ncbi:NAD(P)/FAD-dependent oxidoreductase, partial [Candidatus Bathyarchaeota archaeon]
VDATGTERAFLPRIRDDEIYFTLQSLKKHRIEEDIFIYVRRTGYAWAFPLGDNLWHVGVGEKSMREAMRLLRLLRRKYGFEEKRSLCHCRSRVRLMPPSKCMPFLHGSVVGVGEAIGCISGFGEGNLPALQSAKILYECIMSNRLGEYERRILSEFKWIEEEHELVRWAQSNRKKGRLRMAPRVISIFTRRALVPTPKTFRDVIHQLRLGSMGRKW